MEDDLQKFRGNIMWQRYPRQGTSSEGNIFRIVSVHPEQPGPDLSVKGEIPDWDPEDLFEFYGKVVDDPKYGATFVASQAVKLIPTSLVGKQRFLERWVEGVGPKTAAQLTAHFGHDIIEILDKQPMRLAECPGITQAKADKIAASWLENHDPLLRQVGLWLAQFGIGDVWAKRFIAIFGNKVTETLQKNPYKAMAVDGIGFRKADDLAKRMGWPERCPERTEAAVTHVVTEGTGHGHCFLPAADLITAVRKIASSRRGVTEDEEMQLPELEAIAAITRSVDRKRLMKEEIQVNGKPWVFYYLPHIHEAEVRLARRIGELQSFLHVAPRGIEETLERVEADLGQIPNEQQRDAVIAALLNNLSILTGGPGTGKTTTLKMLLRTAARLGLRVELCAPTGRAAKRMSEVTEQEAQTIHKLLEWDPEMGDFLRDRSNPLHCDLLVVDEASMLDIQLADSLMDAVSDACSVVFVGDIDQLPSVGPGMVLRDLINSNRVHVTKLETIFRQAENSLIIRNAHKIRTGQMPIFPDVKKGRNIEADSYFMEVPKATEGEGKGKDDLEWIKKMLPAVINRIVVKHGIDPVRDLQVLMPMRKGPAGFPVFNTVLQATLNPDGKEVAIRAQKFRIGDRVMQLSNDYKLEIFNGDIGFIKEFDEINKEIQIDFYGKIVRYPYAETDDLVLAYAATVHKSQGSEFSFVICIMTNHHFPMLQRNLLYTANTRAKKMIVFIAAWNAVKLAVEQCDVNQRFTFLAHRVRKEVKAEANLPKAA